MRAGMDPFQWYRGQPLGLQYSARGHPLTRRNRRRVGLGDGAVGRSAARAARCAGARHHGAPRRLKVAAV